MGRPGPSLRPHSRRLEITERVGQRLGARQPGMVTAVWWLAGLAGRELVADDEPGKVFTTESVATQ